MNAACYSELLEKVREACRSERGKISFRTILLLHDNARPHTPAVTQEKLGELPWIGHLQFYLDPVVQI